MRTLKIAIDLNDVVRDYYDKFHGLYCSHFGINEEDMVNPDGTVTEGFALPELKTNNLLDYYPEFEGSVSALNQFIFEEVAMELSANAEPKDLTTFGAMSMFTEAMKDEEQDLYICSREFAHSVGGTYKFLGYHRCPINKTIFEGRVENLWKHFDVIITANPGVIASKPEGKIVVKIDATYNTDVEADITYETLVQIMGDPDGFLSKVEDVLDINDEKQQ
jgi:hypothetical protein